MVYGGGGCSHVLNVIGLDRSFLLYLSYTIHSFLMVTVITCQMGR